MKKIFFCTLFLGFCFFALSQNTPQVGDTYIIKEPSAQNYNYIKFPRLNILVKRGKVANYKSIYGNYVVIDEVISSNDGDTYVILKKKDGSKFFGYLNKVKANYNKAIEANELASKK